MRWQKTFGKGWEYYANHRRNAGSRGVPFLLTFEEWAGLWLASGKWARRGRGRGQYCMARYGDKGAYELGNVRICPTEENRAERNKGHPLKGERNPAYGQDYWATMSADVRARRKAQVSSQFGGKLWAKAQRAKMVATITGRRRVLRNGRMSWAYPGDADFPLGGTF